MDLCWYLSIWVMQCKSENIMQFEATFLGWVTKQKSFRNMISHKNTFTETLQAITFADLSCSLFLSSLNRLFFLPHYSFPVSSIMHVFTSKVIVPDLYDRPLTLHVLVHQHQAENTQGHEWAGPNLVLCHSLTVTSN